MRLSSTLLFIAAIIIIENPSYIFAARNDIPTLISNIAVSNLVSSVNAVDNDQPVRRALRTDQVTDYQKEEEERSKKLLRMFSDITDDGADTAIRLTRSKSLPGFTDKEKLERLIEDKDLRKRAVKYFAKEKKLTPEAAMTTWGISEKLKTMSMTELSIDPVYLFWRQYTKYWNKKH